MNKYDVVRAIMELADENEQLKHKLAMVSAQAKIERLSERMRFEGGDEMNDYQKMFYKIGRNEVFEKVGSDWYGDIKVRRTEDGELKVSSYEDWLDGHLEGGTIPNYMSKKEVEREFDEELHVRYEDKKRKKIDEFLEGEKEDE